jgi:hypothetical protein
MTRSIKALVVTLVAVSALVAAGSAGAQEYVPFVTDFPRSGGTAEFIPFVTDFAMEPRPAGEPVVIGPKRLPSPVAGSPSRNWGDMTVAWTLGFAFALVLGATALGVRRRLGAPAH